jgi:hypothetical protein
MQTFGPKVQTPPRGDKSSWDEKKETHNKGVSIADISNNEVSVFLSPLFLMAASSVFDCSERRTT